MDAKLLACLRSGAEIPPPLVPIVYEYGAFLVSTLIVIFLNMYWCLQILRDFPVGSEFGIDYKSWKTGDQFMGLKMIPPGVHFVYVSVKGMPRIGVFYLYWCRVNCSHFRILPQFPTKRSFGEEMEQRDGGS